MAVVSLTADGIAELALDHAEGRLDVRPLVVVGEEVVPAIDEVAVHLLPGAAPGPACPMPAPTAGVALESDERGCPERGDGIGVLDAAVPLVRRYVRHGEVPG